LSFGAHRTSPVCGSIFSRRRSSPEDNTPKLAALGITLDESSRWQKLAAMPQAEFDEAIGAAATLGAFVTNPM
jgi:hypothetical protein